MSSKKFVEIDYDDFYELCRLSNELKDDAQIHNGFMNTGEVGKVLDEVANNIQDANQANWVPEIYVQAAAENAEDWAPSFNKVAPTYSIQQVAQVGTVAENEDTFEQPNVA